MWISQETSAMSAQSSILLLVTLWVSMQDGLGLPVMPQLELEAGEPVQTRQVRTKRCACSNQLDSECHYFCHLDIIWINTPSKTTVYGLGRASARSRRSIGRCTCAIPDQSCTSFCHSRPDTKPARTQPLRKHPSRCCSQGKVKESLGCICG